MKKNMHHDANHHRPIPSHHSFSDPVFFAEKFDALERDEWQKPDAVIASLKLPDNAVVIEIGSGTGYFAIRLAKHIKKGKIICFDQSPDMTSYLQKRAITLGLTNIDARNTQPDGSCVIEEKANLIFSVDVYHHIQNRVAYFSKIGEHLKPEGHLVIVDRTDEKIEGQPSGHRVPKENIKKEMKEAGYNLIEELNFLLPVQYYLAFKRTQ